MSLIYKKFREYLQDRYITKEEILDVLCRTVPESELLKRSVVVLDGFTGFTPVQNRLLAELMKLTRDVIVTVTIDDREDPYRYTDACQMFGMSKHTVINIDEDCQRVRCGADRTGMVKKETVLPFSEKRGTCLSGGASFPLFGQILYREAGHDCNS